MTLPGPGYDAAVTVARLLREAGHLAYLAGGCVRDALLGRPAKDYDVATAAHPDQVKAVFHRARYVGEAFGVVLVAVKRHQIEVATFREEWGYADRRRPDHVRFSDARHDARRRDFTINGMFLDPFGSGDAEGDHPVRRELPGYGTVIDYVGGLEDLRSRVIRCIGDADDRFGEDYLRMLRAVRFAARLDFELEPRTAAAIRPNAKYLGQISRERIGGEVLTMLESPTRARAARLMQDLKLDSSSLNEDHAQADLAVLAALPARSNVATALAAWMLDRHGGGASLPAARAFVERQSGRVLDRWRKALCLSNEHRDQTRDALSSLAALSGWPDLSVAARKRLMAHDGWLPALTLTRIVDPAAAEQIARDATGLQATGISPTPLIDGNDLIAIGLKPGPRFKQLLDSVYDAQLEGQVSTREDALRWLHEAAARSPQS